MLELRFRKLCLQLDFSFFAVASVFVMADKTGLGIAALAACVIHEISHLIIMALCNITPERIKLYGAGIRITSVETDSAKQCIKMLILLGGSAANFLTALYFYFSGNNIAAMISLLTGMFNLLPIGNLDGAKLLKMLIIRKCRPEHIDRTMKIAEIISCTILILIVCCFSRNISFTLLTTALYLIVAGFETS